MCTGKYYYLISGIFLCDTADAVLHGVGFGSQQESYRAGNFCGFCSFFYLGPCLIPTHYQEKVCERERYS